MVVRSLKKTLTGGVWRRHS